MRISRNIFTLLLVAICGTMQAQPKVETFVKQLQKSTNDTHKLSLIDSVIANTNNTDTLIKYATNGLELARRLNNPDSRANKKYTIGLAYKNRGDIDKAYEFIIKANELYVVLNDTLNQALCCEALGEILAIKGSSGTADGFYNRSLELYKQLNKEIFEARIYRNMGRLCLEYKVYDRAYEYFGRALDIDKRNNNTNGIGEDMLNLGYGQMLQCVDENGSQSQLQRAKNDLLLAYNVFANEECLPLLSVCGILADIYLEQAKKTESELFATAIDSCNMYLDKATMLIEHLGAYRYTNDIDLCKAHYALACGDYISSLKTLQNLEQQYQTNEVSMLAQDRLLNIIAEYYETTGNYKMAYSYSKKLSELNRKKNNDGYLVNSTQTKIQNEYDEEIRLREQTELLRELEYKERSQRMSVTIFISVLLIIMLILTVFVIYRSSVRRRKSNLLLNIQNKKLELQQAEILEQNKLLNEQNEEIQLQRDEIEGQRNYLSSQNKIIRNANRQITDSIVYAKRIQEAAIPTDNFMKGVFGDCLIFWRPLNIVSGDFYWATQVGNYKILAVADCTGHGVPGAFMSMLGISLLNDIIASSNVEKLTAASVLDSLRAKLKEALRQTGKQGEADDGIDLAFCIFNTQSTTMQFAGAFRPLIIIRNGELIEYKPDKMPCGIYINESPNFTNNIVELQKNDVLYMYSDGIADQFSGGSDMRKFTIRRVKEMLVKYHQMPFDQQKLLIEKRIDDWRKPASGLGKQADQVDDILLVGLRIS